VQPRPERVARSRAVADHRVLRDQARDGFLLVVQHRKESAIGVDLRRQE
jgi:hypothetical protein